MKRIKLEPGFAVFIALLCFFDREGFLLSFSVAAILHELAHAGAALLLGGKIGQLRLGFADARMEISGLSYARELPVLAAGPIANAALFFVFREKLSQFALVNLLLAGYNLLSVWPLDGGRILHNLFCLFLPKERAEALCLSLSLGCVCFLLAFSFGAMLYWQTGIWPLLLAVTLFAKLALVSMNS